MIKSACLVPYCPLPLDSGARAVFNKHLSLLNELGHCRILSNRSRPVGSGWAPKYIQSLTESGFTLELAEGLSFSRPSQLYGILYALMFKAFRVDRAFGHSNPYHRYAFDPEWIYQKSHGADICEIHYSYWARIPTGCPKIVIVHDLWSDIMWEGPLRETEDLQKADLVVTVSESDRNKLRARGLEHVIWSPPVVERKIFQDSDQVAIVGSANKFNQEGLRWIMQELNDRSSVKINVYGSLAGTLKDHPAIFSYPRYKEVTDPYSENGIILMTTSQGTGIQIKAIEALAFGRAIIARKGAMRGMPEEEKGWLEYDDPAEMLEKVQQLKQDRNKRRELMSRAAQYYEKHLRSDKVLKSLSDCYKGLLQKD